MGGWNLRSRSKSENSPKEGRVAESMRIRTYYLILSSFIKISCQPSLELRNDGISIQWKNRMKKRQEHSRRNAKQRIQSSKSELWLVGEMCVLPLTYTRVLRYRRISGFPLYMIVSCIGSVLETLFAYLTYMHSIS